MSKNKFVCPVCQQKQKLKHLFLLANFIQWNCHKCHTRIKPETMKPTAGIIGFFLGLGSMNILLYYFKLPFFISVLYVLPLGLLAYIITVIYYYGKIKLEVVE